jgi:peptidyl-prolyl cis-trans isomerase SurA
MKYTTFIIITILFFSNSFAKIIDQAIVIIENDVITQSEFEKKFNFIMNQYRIAGQPMPSNIKTLKKQILEHMINTRLQLQYAERNGLEVKEWMLDKAMENMAKKNGVTLTEFREQIINQGLNYKIYRSVMREDLITREVQRRIISNRVRISQKEIKEFIKHQSHVFKQNDEYKISNILVALSETPSMNEKLEAEKKILMIKNKFINGKKFSDLAKNYSDSGSALSGGNLGWKKISQIPKMFLKDLEKLNSGQISNIINSSNGYYLFYLEDKKEMKNIEIKERKTRHILIKTNAIVTNEIAFNKLNELKKRIERGESFANLARAHSDDTMSAANGGMLGWAAAGSFVPEYEDQLDKLPLNKISEPFSSQFGWHIMELLEKRNQDNTEVIMKNLAKKHITASRSGEVIDSWIIELKSKNYVKYIDEKSSKNNISSDNKAINYDEINKQLWDPFSE